MGNIFHDNNGKLDEVSAYHPYDHSDDGSEYTSFFPSLGRDDRNQMGSTVKTRCSTAETDLDFPPTLGSVISHMPRKSTIEMQLKSLFFFHGITADYISISMEEQVPCLTRGEICLFSQWFTSMVQIRRSNPLCPSKAF